MKREFTLSALFGVLAFASCQKAETPQSVLEEGSVMHFSTNVVDTRAGAQTDNITQFGVIVDSEDARFSYENVAINRQPNNTWLPEQMMLWRAGDSPIQVTAYAPYSEQLPEKVAVMTDQSLEQSIIASDFLYSSSPVNPSAPNRYNPIYYDTSSKTVAVGLTHHLSKFKMIIYFDMAFSPKSSPVESVQIHGTKTEAMIDLGTGALTLSSDAVTSPITPYEIPTYWEEPTQTRVTYEAIIIPQTVLSGDFEISVTVGGVVYSWISADDIFFESNKQLNMNLTLQGTRVSGMTVNSTAWTDGGTVSDNIDKQ